MCNMPKYIVFEKHLLNLFQQCSVCGAEVVEKELSQRGSTTKVTSQCRNAHSLEWHSQLW